MKIDDQVKIWKWAASILPLTALAVISLSYFLGTDTWLKCAIIATVAGFMLASFTWWWWAIDKIRAWFKLIGETQIALSEIKDDIKEVKKDVSDR
jgi:hypothetical protein